MSVSAVDCSYGFMFSLQLDTDEVTVENSMSKSFDQIIRLQLDPVWNQLVLIRYMHKVMYMYTMYMYVPGIIVIIIISTKKYSEIKYF